MVNALAVGLIGCGRIAQAAHLPLLRRLPGARLTALAEADAPRRAAAARLAPHARPYADYGDLLAQPDLDAIVICLPPALHAAAAIAAFQAGKHVYLEKPLATELDAGAAVLAAWRAAGQVGMIGFNYRFNPLYQAVRQLLQAGRIGELVAARSVFSTAAADGPGWNAQPGQGGGALLDLASHHVDLLPYLLGEPIVTVSAATHTARSEDDTATLDLRLASGLLAQTFCSRHAVEEDRVEIYGQAGKLSVDRYRSLAPVVEPPYQRGARSRQLRQGARMLLAAPYLARKARAPLHEPSYATALATFVAAARGGRPGRPDLADGYQSLAVIVAAEQAAASGRTITIDKEPA